MYPIRTTRRAIFARLAASSIDETRSLSNELRNDAYRRGVRSARPSSTSRKVKAGLFGSLAGGERADRSNWSKNESTASHETSTSPRHRLDIASTRAEAQLVNSVRVTQLTWPTSPTLSSERSCSRVRSDVLCACIFPRRTHRGTRSVSLCARTRVQRLCPLKYNLDLYVCT